MKRQKHTTYVREWRRRSGRVHRDKPGRPPICTPERATAVMSRISASANNDRALVARDQIKLVVEASAGGVLASHSRRRFHQLLSPLITSRPPGAPAVASKSLFLSVSGTADAYEPFISEVAHQQPDGQMRLSDFLLFDETSIPLSPPKWYEKASRLAMPADDSHFRTARPKTLISMLGMSSKSATTAYFLTGEGDLVGPPAVILPRASLSANDFEGPRPECITVEQFDNVWVAGASEGGFQTDLFANFLIHFLQHLPDAGDRQRVLILDRAAVHLAAFDREDVRNALYDKRVNFFLLAGGVTGALQPHDAVVFNKFKNKFRLLISQVSEVVSSPAAYLNNEFKLCRNFSNVEPFERFVQTRDYDSVVRNIQGRLNGFSPVLNTNQLIVHILAALREISLF